MKILIICDLYLPVIGGAEFAVNSLAKQFVKKGHEVFIIASRIPRKLPEKDIIDGIPVERLYFSIPHNTKSRLVHMVFSGKTQKKLNKIIEREQPDVVDLYFASENTMYALEAKKKFNFPFVISLQGNDIHKNIHKSQKHKKIISEAVESADYVTGSSENFLLEVRNTFPSITKKSGVTANGIDPEKFSSEEKYTSEKLYVFSIGRFEHKKGFDMLIRAYKQIKGDVELIIAGSGDELQKCKNLAASDKRIKLIGNVSEEEKVKLYRGCEFFVLPSRIEPFGITNLQPMICRKAVLATNVGGVSEIVTKKSGMLVAPDSDSIKNGIEQMLKRKDLKKLGENGKRFVEKNYTWDKISDRYLKIFKEVLKHERSSGSCVEKKSII